MKSFDLTAICIQEHTLNIWVGENCNALGKALLWNKDPSPSAQKYNSFLTSQHSKRELEHILFNFTKLLNCTLETVNMDSMTDGLFIPAKLFCVDILCP